MSTSAHPHADASVRLARSSDAAEIARVQEHAWQVGYALLLPRAATDAFDRVSAEASWAAAIASPPTPHHHVLVALENSRLVGFAAVAPASDPDLDASTDAEVLALHVEPGHQRRGHGSRLMAAIVDYARGDGFTRLITWAFAADDAMRAFLRDNGWDADAATRDLDVGELAHQVRLHTLLAVGPELTDSG